MLHRDVSDCRMQAFSVSVCLLETYVMLQTQGGGMHLLFADIETTDVANVCRIQAGILSAYIHLFGIIA